VHITKEDQQRINTFANKNAKMNEIKADIEKKKKDLINLEDAENDILLIDSDEDLIPFRIGEVFVQMPTDDVNQLIEKQKEELQGEISELETEVESLKKTLADLKVQLYSKFGNNINLEEDED